MVYRAPCFTSNLSKSSLKYTAKLMLGKFTQSYLLCGKFKALLFASCQANIIHFFSQRCIAQKGNAKLFHFVCDATYS